MRHTTSNLYLARPLEIELEHVACMFVDLKIRVYLSTISRFRELLRRLSADVQSDAHAAARQEQMIMHVFILQLDGIVVPRLPTHQAEI